jgi:hypothetical protein
LLVQAHNPSVSIRRSGPGGLPGSFTVSRDR